MVSIKTVCFKAYFPEMYINALIILFKGNDMNEIKFCFSQEITIKYYLQKLKIRF